MVPLHRTEKEKVQKSRTEMTYSYSVNSGICIQHKVPHWKSCPKTWVVFGQGKTTLQRNAKGFRKSSLNKKQL